MPAIGSPRSSEERQYHRPAGKQRRRRYASAVVPHELEGGRRLADLDDAVEDAGTAQILGRAVHDRSLVGRDTRRRSGARGGEFAFKRHVGSFLVSGGSRALQAAQRREQFARVGTAGGGGGYLGIGH